MGPSITWRLSFTPLPPGGGILGAETRRIWANSTTPNVPSTPPPSPQSGEDFASKSLVIWSMFQSAEPPKRHQNTTLGFGNPVWRASGGVGEHHAVCARCVCRLPPHAPPPAPRIANLVREGLDRPTEHSGGTVRPPQGTPNPQGLT